MKVSVGENGVIVLEDVFNAVVLRTPIGDFGVQQRDGGIEVVREGLTVFSEYNKLTAECRDVKEL